MKWTNKLMQEVAQEERVGLGLGPFDVLDPYLLCQEHGIDVYAIDELAAFGASGEAISHLIGEGPTRWSAALAPIGTSCVILENPAHPEVRRRSNIAHELGHFLLEHEFGMPELSGEHRHKFDVQQEKQAKFMSGELLISEQAANKAAFKGLTNQDVALRYGVSEAFAQMRMAGPRKYAERALARQARERR